MLATAMVMHLNGHVSIYTGITILSPLCLPIPPPGQVLLSVPSYFGWLTVLLFPLHEFGVGICTKTVLANLAAIVAGTSGA
jgi:uncharacterized protein involved in cysteine biosynthesis